MVFTSCTKNELETEGNDPVAVNFISAIAAPTPMTKASGATWGPNDEVGIFMVTAGSTTISEGADNRLYTTTGGNAFTTLTPIYYPQSGNVDFIAYYPHVASQTLSATYLVNVATQTSQAAIDLLYSNNATAKSKGAATVPLTFKHQLSKVIINTTAGDGLTAADLTNMTVTIKGMNTAAPFNLATGLLEASTTPADITALPVAMGSKYEAIVLPASLAVGALKMDFALNNAKNEVFTRTNTAEEVFEAGKVYTYTITVKRTGVTFTCTITDWIAEPDRTGDAE
ncbi:MAG: fimbrillin family protein [Saezia sp.]